MAAALFFLNCDNKQLEDLVLRCVEAGIKVQVRLIDELPLLLEDQSVDNMFVKDDSTPSSCQKDPS